MAQNTVTWIISKSVEGSSHDLISDTNLAFTYRIIICRQQG